LTRKEKRAQYRKQQRREHEASRGVDFDPKTDNGCNTNQFAIKEAYQDLKLMNEDGAAAKLRGLESTTKQKSYLTSLRDAGVLDQ
jgi:hypothetical protein